MSVTASCAPSLPSTVTGTRSDSRWVKIHLASFVSVIVSFALALFSALSDSLGAESSPSPSATGQIGETDSQDVVRAYLQLQEQLLATQLAIEQNHQETKEATAQTMGALSKGLQTIQEAFAVQRARNLEAMQRSNKVMLVLAGTFAAIAFLTLLMMTCFLWRVSKGLAKISAALPAALGVGPGSAVAGLGPAEQSNLRLLEAREQHEKRIHELEQSSQPAFKPRGAPHRSIQRRLFPCPGDSFRRRQFRALKAALIVGLLSAAVMTLVLYLVHSKPLP